MAQVLLSVTGCAPQSSQYTCSRWNSPRATVFACGKCRANVTAFPPKHELRVLKIYANNVNKQEVKVDKPNSSSKVSTDQSQEQLADHSIATRVALSLLQAYKGYISPLLPSVCRFQPSCSTYSMEAFQQFGASKGSILMAWRLLRCNPFRGGYQGQYDPPTWPPVGLGTLFRE